MLDLQYDGLTDAGVSADYIYKDAASGKREDRTGLSACLKALSSGDVFLVWKLDRQGRDLRHLINTVQSLSDRGVGIKGARRTTCGYRHHNGKWKANFRHIRHPGGIRKRAHSGTDHGRPEIRPARGRKGGRRFALSKSQVRQTQASMGKPETVVSELCKEFGITRATLYRYGGPKGELREYGRRVLGKKS